MPKSGLVVREKFHSNRLYSEWAGLVNARGKISVARQGHQLESQFIDARPESLAGGVVVVERIRLARSRTRMRRLRADSTTNWLKLDTFRCGLGFAVVVLAYGGAAPAGRKG